MEHLFTVRTVHHVQDEGDDDRSTVLYKRPVDTVSSAVSAGASVLSIGCLDKAGVPQLVVCNMAAAKGAFEKVVYSLRSVCGAGALQVIQFGMKGAALVLAAPSSLAIINTVDLISATQPPKRRDPSMMRGFSASSPLTPRAVRQAVPPQSAPAPASGVFDWLLGASSQAAAPAEGAHLSVSTQTLATTVSLGHISADVSDIECLKLMVEAEVRQLRMPMDLPSCSRSCMGPAGNRALRTLGPITAMHWWSPWLLQAEVLILGHASGHVTMWDVSVLGPQKSRRLPTLDVVARTAREYEGVTAVAATPDPSGLLWWGHLPEAGAIVGLSVSGISSDMFLGDAFKLAMGEGTTEQAVDTLRITGRHQNWRMSMHCLTMSPTSGDRNGGQCLFLDGEMWAISEQGYCSPPGVGYFTAGHKLAITHDGDRQFKMEKCESRQGSSLQGLKLAAPKGAALTYSRQGGAGSPDGMAFAVPPVAPTGSCWNFRSLPLALRLCQVEYRPDTRRVLAFSAGSGSRLEMLLQLPEPEVLMHGLSPPGQERAPTLPLHLQAASMGSGEAVAGLTHVCDWEVMEYGKHILLHERFLWIAWSAKDRRTGQPQSFVAVLSVSEASKPSATVDPATRSRAGDGAPPTPSAAVASSMGGHVFDPQGDGGIAGGVVAPIPTPTHQGLTLPALAKVYAGSTALAVFTLPPGEVVQGVHSGRCYAEDRVPRMAGSARQPTAAPDSKVMCLPSGLVFTDVGLYEVAPVTITSAGHFLAASASQPSLGFALSRALALQTSQVCRFMGQVAAAELRQASAGVHLGRPGQELALSALQCFSVARTAPSEVLQQLHRTEFALQAAVYVALSLGFKLSPCAWEGELEPQDSYLLQLAGLARSEGADESLSDPTLATREGHASAWKRVSGVVVPSVSAIAVSKLSVKLAVFSAWNGLCPDEAGAGNNPFGFHPVEVAARCPMSEVGTIMQAWAAAGRLQSAVLLQWVGLQTGCRAWATAQAAHVVAALAAAVSGGFVHTCTAAPVLGSLVLGGLADALATPPLSSVQVEMGLVQAHAIPHISAAQAPWEAVLEVQGQDGQACVGHPCLSITALWGNQECLPGQVWDTLLGALSLPDLVSLLCFASPSRWVCHAPRLLAAVQDVAMGVASGGEWLPRLLQALLPCSSPRLHTSLGRLSQVEGKWVLPALPAAAPSAPAPTTVRVMDGSRVAAELALAASAREFWQGAHQGLQGHIGLLGLPECAHPALVQVAASAILATATTKASGVSAGGDKWAAASLASLEGEVRDSRSLASLASHASTLQLFHTASILWKQSGEMCLSFRMQCAAACSHGGGVWDLAASLKECGAAGLELASCCLLALAAVHSLSATQADMDTWLQQVHTEGGALACAMAQAVQVAHAEDGSAGFRSIVTSHEATPRGQDVSVAAVIAGVPPRVLEAARSALTVASPEAKIGLLQVCAGDSAQGPGGVGLPALASWLEDGHS